MAAAFVTSTSSAHNAAVSSTTRSSRRGGFLRSNFFKRLRNGVLIGAVSIGVRGLYLTMRFRSQGWERARACAEGGGVIYVIWHNVLMLPLGHPCRRGVRALVSVGKDGEFAARVIRTFGIGAIRGSTSRAGSRALKEAVESVNDKAGSRLAVTPDGPRGPRYQFQSGAVWLASVTGLPVVPIGVGITRAWRLRSWDRYRIPKPFSRAEFVFGEPTYVPANLDREQLEEHRARLQTALSDASREAAQKAGVTWRATS